MAESGGTRIRLEQHGVTERERGRHGADGEDQRSVERGDHAHDSGRQTAGHAEPRRLRTQQLAIRLGGQGGGREALLVGDVDLKACHWWGCPRFADEPSHHLRCMLLPELCGTSQDLGTGVKRELRPGDLSFRGPSSRTLHVRRAGQPRRS
jgi:hypothetical protein